MSERAILLDPALGTGTFLYDVIKRIHESFARNQGAWPSYVAERLIPRIFGFELLVAPYVMAHLKLGLLLHETGYNPRTSEERLGVYLTNTLAEGIDAPAIPFAGYISDEANAATGVKRDKPIMVVMGNPPYSGHSANASRTPQGLTWIGRLIQDYYQVDGKPLGERNPKWLQDDYVKFVRFGQWRINQTGQGVLAFINNHSYIDNPTFRGMRQSLMNTFSRIYVLDLHGNSRKREVAPDGGPDENVFDIQQGVAIGLFVKEPGATGPAKIYHGELWGRRESKYESLAALDVSDTEWTEITPQAPFYFFKPQNTDILAEYQQGWRVPDAMAVNSVGIVTSRDGFVFDFDEAALRRRISDFLDPSNSDDEVRERYFGTQGRGQYLAGDNRDWRMSAKRRAIQQDPNWRNAFRKCLYRPFDIRPLFYHDDAIDFDRSDVMRHMLAGENLGLDSCRQVPSGSWQHALVANNITDDNYISNRTRERGYLFPLHLYPEPGHAAYSRGDAINAASQAIRRNNALSALEQSTQLDEIKDLITHLYPREEYPRLPNLAPRFIAEIAEKTGLRYDADGRNTSVGAALRGRPVTVGERRQAQGPAPTDGRSATHGVPQGVGVSEQAGESTSPSGNTDSFTPEDVFYYMYAILFSPTYRSRYAEFLRSDFPRIPITSDPALFLDLASLGKRLTDLHLLRGEETLHATSLQEVAFPVAGTDIVERVQYVEAERSVFINRSQHFANVPPEVWEFHVGGYQVCEKWLKDRKGRKLSYADIEHYEKVVAALGRTIEIMGEIDERIPAWPVE